MWLHYDIIVVKGLVITQLNKSLERDSRLSVGQSSICREMSPEGGTINPLKDRDVSWLHLAI